VRTNHFSFVELAADRIVSQAQKIDIRTISIIPLFALLVSIYPRRTPFIEREIAGCTPTVTSEVDCIRAQASLFGMG